MRRTAIAAMLGSVIFAASGRGQEMTSELPDSPPKPSAQPAKGPAEVQLAILLDTSGSMDGLIDQARSQIWNVVNTLGGASRDGEKIRLEVAVYEYGNSRIPQSSGFVRQVQAFTDDLDEVSRALFSLTTKGGDELCGRAIRDAVNGLSWSDSAGVYKAIFIAGNEPFDQGTVTFPSVLGRLSEQSIVVNTVYCGTKYTGEEGWQAASRAAGGDFARIDHDKDLPKLGTPMDPRLRELNRTMNRTFLWYGDGAEKARRNQENQDMNAGKMSDRAFAERMSTKIGHLYVHTQHDLVDAVRHGHIELDRMNPKLMPPELRSLSKAERKRFVEKLISQRESVRREMATVIASRHAFLKSKMSGQPGGPLVWGEALSATVERQARALGYVFPENG